MAAIVAPEQVDAQSLGVYQYVLAQAGQFAIGREFGAPVVGRCGGREHFHHQAGRCLVVAVGAVGFGAGDENVGVEEGVVGFYAQLHVRNEHAARAAPQVGAQGHVHISSQGDMRLGGARHGEDIAVQVFVLFGLLGLPAEVSGGIEPGAGGGDGHGSISRQWVAPIVARRGVGRAPFHATQLPDLPPCFCTTRTPWMDMPRSTALHMS